jgi:hypothetical protein
MCAARTPPSCRKLTKACPEAEELARLTGGFVRLLTQLMVHGRAGFELLPHRILLPA